MRQIVLDTETTGIGHQLGHRVIEIGCIELIDRKMTGNHFHVYLNPEREVDEGAFKVHGISTAFLQDKPKFQEILSEFLTFIKGAELIIHNAPFDVGFLNNELSKAKADWLLADHCQVLDTLVLAREKHAGQRNSLDALCKRYEIDNSNRKFHGALLDAEILAQVYLAMTGGQFQLFIEEETTNRQKTTIASMQTLTSNTPVLHATAEENKQHLEFIEYLQKKAGKNLWEVQKEEAETVI